MNTLKFSSHDRVLILAPHPDDESLATGGLIQRAVKAGAKVRVALVTDGDNNPWPQRFVERRLKIRRKDRARWGRRRRKEALAALARLGLDRKCTRFLGLPDQGITGLLLGADEKALAAIRAEIKEWRPTLLVAPSSGDAHPDHSAIFVLAQLALAQLAETKQTPPRVLRYVIHAPRRLGERRRVTLHLSDEEIQSKREAILCHDSQMALSRKRFTGYAREQEVFYADAPTTATSSHHAVASAELARGALQLHLRLRSSRARFAGWTLLLAIESNTNGSIRWALPMPSSSRCVELEDAQTGEPARLATVRIRGRTARVSVPIAPLQPIRQIFVKLERRRFLYDEAGWREVPVEPNPAVATNIASPSEKKTRSLSQQARAAARTILALF